MGSAHWYLAIICNLPKLVNSKSASPADAVEADVAEVAPAQDTSVVADKAPKSPAVSSAKVAGATGADPDNSVDLADDQSSEMSMSDDEDDNSTPITGPGGQVLSTETTTAIQETEAGDGVEGDVIDVTSSKQANETIPGARKRTNLRGLKRIAVDE